eukprot:COSAG04_NODE_7033_length_1205_cov_1.536166_1_plen_55_part_10
MVKHWQQQRAGGFVSPAPPRRRCAAAAGGMQGAQARYLERRFQPRAYTPHTERKP